jgi:hypothetical protein
MRDVSYRPPAKCRYDRLRILLEVAARRYEGFALNA